MRSNPKIKMSKKNFSLKIVKLKMTSTKMNRGSKALTIIKAINQK